jgi:hypothetical protein
LVGDERSPPPNPRCAQGVSNPLRCGGRSRNHRSRLPRPVRSERVAPIPSGRLEMKIAPSSATLIESPPASPNRARVVQESRRGRSREQGSCRPALPATFPIRTAAVVLAAVKQAIGQVVDSAGPSLWVRAGLVAYLAVAVFTAYILWPRRKRRFHFSPARRLQWLYLESPQPLSVSIIKRDLALHLDAYLEHNARKIDRMSWALAGSIALLLLGTASLVYYLWT